MNSPYALVTQHYTLPFTLYPYQVETVNELAPLPRSGHYLAVGVGKTATSTVCALYKLKHQGAQIVLVLMPPILIPTWKRWLESIKGTSVKDYRGSPKQRAEIEFDADFILMSYDIFKRDQEMIQRKVRRRRVVLICDEATAIKSVESKNYKTVRDFCEDGDLMLLTGTPLSKVLDGYAYVKLLAPVIYRNYKMFTNVHVIDFDYWGAPTGFQNLDLLKENMSVNAVRLLKEDVLKDLPAITYSPMYYDLTPEHARLYRELVSEQLLALPDGGKIDATQTTALWHACQQIVIGWSHFSGDESVRPAAFDILDQVLEELDDQKLIVFTNYRFTSRLVNAYLQKVNAVPVYGEISGAQQQKNIDRFMADPSCRALVAQVQSAGYGLNLQGVCSNVLFLESPLVPLHFEQAVGRVYRNGQQNKVQVRVAIANKTLQVRLHGLLMAKDALVNKVVRSHKDLRNSLYGDE
jgi:SNF2 family DNA or RNA helicase